LSNTSGMPVFILHFGFKFYPKTTDKKFSLEDLMFNSLVEFKDLAIKDAENIALKN